MVAYALPTNLNPHYNGRIVLTNPKIPCLMYYPLPCCYGGGLGKGCLNADFHSFKVSFAFMDNRSEKTNLSL